MSENEAHEGMTFDILRSAVGDGLGARLGRLAFPGRNTVQTPNFFGVTSRGAVPHLTPDNVSRYKPFEGAYFALEDCEAISTRISASI